MLHVWAFRNPTLFGYATLIDTLALLIEIQKMSIKPDKKKTEIKVTRDLQNNILNFIRHGRIDNICRNFMINDKHSRFKSRAYILFEKKIRR